VAAVVVEGKSGVEESEVAKDERNREGRDRKGRVGSVEGMKEGGRGEGVINYHATPFQRQPA
jgi:hypothetical protein